MLNIPAGWKPVPAPLYDHILTGDLESLLWQLKGVREAEEVRMALYNARQTILGSSAPGNTQDEQPQRNGCGSVSFKLSDGSAVSCDWSSNEWELSIPAKRHDRDIAFKELLQEIGRLRALGAAPAAGDALPTIKGAAITGGYVVVTPAGWGEDKPQKVRDAILRLFPVNPAYTPKSGTALATQQGEA